MKGNNILLEDIYDSYYQMANLKVPDWKQVDKSVLCNKYLDTVDENPQQAEGYMAAIVCKYWPKINRFYYQTPLVCSPEDCYDWLITSILEAFSRSDWRKPDNKLYNDPNAPDKVINCIMKCTRINFIVAANRIKRKININTASKDELDENLGDNISYDAVYFTENLTDDIEKETIIKYMAQKKLYLLLFICDAIYNLDCFKDKALDEKKLQKQISTLSDFYLKSMAEEYNISFNDIKNMYFCAVKNKNASALKNDIHTSLSTLKYLYFKEEI